MSFLVDYDNKLAQEIEALKSRLSRGEASSYEEYKSLAGQIRGLTSARNTLADMAKTTSKENRP